MLKLRVLKADITTVEADAVVNAANSSLTRGGGVCGAIFRASGAALDRACSELGSCVTGDAVTTPAFEMKTASFIIHAVGPVFQANSDSSVLLESTYRAVIRECAKNEITSVAIPCISTGIFGYPQLPAAGIAVGTIRRFAHEAPSLKEVIFCCFNDLDLNLYEKLLKPSEAKA